MLHPLTASQIHATIYPFTVQAGRSIVTESTDLGSSLNTATHYLSGLG